MFGFKMKVPKLILRQLYTFGSLRNSDLGVRFSIKNRLNTVTLLGIKKIEIDGQSLPLEKCKMEHEDGSVTRLTEITPDNPLEFHLGNVINVICEMEPLEIGKHRLDFEIETKEYGTLKFDVEDSIPKEEIRLPKIPRSDVDNYSDDIIKKRWDFIEQYTGKRLNHIAHYSFDPHVAKGNIENFVGVAQVPMGIAGPIKVNGEYAQGEFLVPLATSEGTLVASYNRGIKVMNLSGGVKSTVVDDAMQRAPVFVFDDARQARDFVQWVDENFPKIKEEAEATSSVAKLKYIEKYLSNKFAYLRFNFLTGDAAGQNMVGRATFAACSWILENYPHIKHFYLESNFATDKKASQVNMMRTRGKRVTAEATIKRDVLIQFMRVDPETLYYHYNVANVGSILSGAHNNGLHSPNAITAIFIATGQDVANVAESSAGLLYTELTPEGDFYISLTIPSLIVATYGGGTGLPTQREALELMGCYGKGKVRKFAEIVAAVALAGEISLASAISSWEWVSSHEKYGRNR